MTHNLKKIITISSLVLLFFIITGYAYYRSQNLLKGVGLQVSGIENGQTFQDSSLELYGRAQNAKHLTINGREIFLDENWNFREEIIFLPGYNIVSVRTEDKFGKVKEKEYRVTSN